MPRPRMLTFRSQASAALQALLSPRPATAPSAGTPRAVATAGWERKFMADLHAVTQALHDIGCTARPALASEAAASNRTGQRRRSLVRAESPTERAPNSARPKTGASAVAALEQHVKHRLVVLRRSAEAQQQLMQEIEAFKRQGAEARQVVMRRNSARAKQSAELCRADRLAWHTRHSQRLEAVRQQRGRIEASTLQRRLLQTAEARVARAVERRRALRARTVQTGKWLLLVMLLARHARLAARIMQVRAARATAGRRQDAAHAIVHAWRSYCAQRQRRKRARAMGILRRFMLPKLRRLRVVVRQRAARVLHKLLQTNRITLNMLRAFHRLREKGGYAPLQAR